MRRASRIAEDMFKKTGEPARWRTPNAIGALHGVGVGRVPPPRSCQPGGAADERVVPPRTGFHREA